VIFGVGEPDILHCNFAGSPRLTLTSVGLPSTLGLTQTSSFDWDLIVSRPFEATTS
jgi:hypothetical protein